MGEDIDMNIALRVADIVSKFISAIDMLALEMYSVDSVAPAVKDLHSSIKTYPNLPSTYEGIRKVESWLKYFEGKAAHDTLDETNGR